MKKEWNETVITKIALAVYVAPNVGRHIHKNRPFHGFVLNDGEGIKDYCFSDGRVMHTEGGALFYLPKDSSYFVKTIRSGGCYAINFDADIRDVPFAVTLRNSESLLHDFKTAINTLKSREFFGQAAAMRALYHAIYQIQCELNKQYIPSDRASILLPAIEKIERDFAENNLMVSQLAALCGTSEVYFRRLFSNRFGVSPKEYVIQKRMAYAKELLCSADFSVSEIATMCGYADACHFSREFSRRVGVPPIQYFGE